MKILEYSLHRFPITTTIEVADLTGRFKLPPCILTNMRFDISGKLLSRSFKIAHALLNKTFTSKNNSGGPLTGDHSIKPGDRVALVYPNNDPISFMCAFYGCLQAGVVPVPIEVPLSRRDAGLQQVGFLLGSCAIQYALTSDACLKGPFTKDSILTHALDMPFIVKGFIFMIPIFVFSLF